MNKTRAFLFHFFLSAAIVGALLAIVFLVWFPRPFFEIGGAWNVVKILVGVHLVLGPVLTLIVYKPEKPGLRFDLTAIAVIQLVALLYGTVTIYSERPQYLVFVGDRFNLIAGPDIDGQTFADTDWRKKPLIGPRLAVAEPPADLEEQQKLMFEIVDGAPDLERRPELWHPFDEKKEQVLARARPLSALTAGGSEVAERVFVLEELHEPNAEELVFVPVINRTFRGFALVLDPHTARPLDIVDFDPWDLPKNDPS